MMEVLSLIDHRLMLVQMCESSPEEIILALGKRLVDCQKVTSEYINGVIERELVFPTGLATTSIKVSLPHAGAAHVISPALAIGVLQQPVPFHQMGHPDQTVDVQIIFMLAVKDGPSQAKALGGIAMLLKNDYFLRQLAACSSTDEMYRVTVETILNLSSPEIQWNS